MKSWLKRMLAKAGKWILEKAKEEAKERL